MIVFFSTAFVHWAFHRTGVTYEHRFSLLYTMLLYSVLSVISARVFRTYSGVVRYSGFVDLLKVVYANALTCGLGDRGALHFQAFRGRVHDGDEAAADLRDVRPGGDADAGDADGREDAL